MKKVRIAIVGCGGIANQKHMPSLKKFPDRAEMVAFCDIIPERAEKAARGYGIPYEAVTEHERLADAVAKMLATKGPYILECAIREDDDVLPMTPPGMNVDDMMLSIAP